MRGIFVAEYQFSVFHTARKKWIMNLGIYANKWMGSCSPLNNRCKVHPFSSLLETLQDFYFIFKFTITNLNWFYFQLPRNINGGFNVYGFKHNTKFKTEYIYFKSVRRWCCIYVCSADFLNGMVSFRLPIWSARYSNAMGRGWWYIFNIFFDSWFRSVQPPGDGIIPHQRICAGLDILKALNISLLFEDNSWIIQ